ncbi:MAG: hypothetical protein AAF558_05900 [Verrucomicrobiota bacterium]
MRHTKNIIRDTGLVMALFCMNVSMLSAESRDIFKRYADQWAPFGTNYSRLGENLDKHGYFMQKIPLGDLHLGDGKTLPLFLEYNTAPRVRSNHLGDHWSIPLLDSHLWHDTQRTTRFIMPLGKEKYFVRYKKDPGILSHNSPQWSGTYGNNRAELIHTNGTLTRYQEGMINEMEFANGRVLEWKRRRDQVIRLAYRAGGEPVLEVFEEGGLLNFEMLQSPGNYRLLQLEREPIYGGIRKILVNEEPYLDIKRGLRKNQNPFMEITQDSDTEIFEWDAKNGKLVRAGDWKYSIKERLKDSTTRPRMNRTHLKEGYSEGYFYDPNRAITETIYRNGLVKREYAINLPGKNFKVLRKIEIEHGKTKYESLRRVFDENGKLTKQIVYDKHTGLKTISNFDENENLLSVALDGKRSSGMLKALAQDKTFIAEFNQNLKPQLEALEGEANLRELSDAAEGLIQQGQEVLPNIIN